MSAPISPEAIAAAWATWKSRHGGKLGPGPAFTEAIAAALAVIQAERSIPTPTDGKANTVPAEVWVTHWDMHGAYEGKVYLSGVNLNPWDDDYDAPVTKYASNTRYVPAGSPDLAVENARLKRVIEGSLEEMRLICGEEDKFQGEHRKYYQGVDAARDTLEIYFKRHLHGLPGAPTFQQRVATVHIPLFHDDPTDVPERRARFFEESGETSQAFGMTREEAHALVDYTWDRPPGDPTKEIGAAVVTLASLCVVSGHDLMACAEADLAKLQRPESIARIRAKRATRHGRGPLPGLDPSSKEDH